MTLRERLHPPRLGRCAMPNAVRETDPRRSEELNIREEPAGDSEARGHENHTEMAHANRVAILGQLSASIVHEVLQPIGATHTNAEAALHLLGHQPPDLEKVRRVLAQIVQDSMRAGNIVNRIRALMKKAPSRKECLDINEAIREGIELTHSEAVKSGVSVQTKLAEHLPLIQGDQVQLQQVMLNLIVNAIEAMNPHTAEAPGLLIHTAKAQAGGVLVV